METKESQPLRAGLAPNTAAVVDAVLAHWPEHAKFLRALDRTRQVLSVLGVAERVNLRLQDLYSPETLSLHAGRFDTVVLSEVLEHLERPREALEIIRELLAPEGAVWINVPANGPAPDHLVLLRSPQEAADFVASAGLAVMRTADFPLAGSSLDRAVRQALRISCVLVGRRTS